MPVPCQPLAASRDIGQRDTHPPQTPNKSLLQFHSRSFIRAIYFGHENIFSAMLTNDVFVVPVPVAKIVETVETPLPDVEHPKSVGSVRSRVKIRVENAHFVYMLMLGRIIIGLLSRSSCWAK